MLAADGEGRLRDPQRREHQHPLRAHDQAVARQLAPNKAAILAAYGERWFRIWHLFLAWSTIIGEQGNAACFQVVLNKNQDSFDRMRWINDRRGHVLGDRVQSFEPPDRVQAAE